MPNPKREIPHELGDSFLRSSAIAAGVPPERLRNADLEAPYRGVRRRREPGREGTPALAVPHTRVSSDHSSASHPLELRRAEHLERARLYSLIANEETFFCGVTAAVVLGLPVPLQAAQPIEVGRLHPGRAPRARNVRGIQVRPRLVSLGTAAGLKVTSPATTWAMLARSLSLEELVILGDAIVFTATGRQGASRKPSLATLRELADAAADPGRRGAPLLKSAATLIRDGSASPPETTLRLVLVNACLPEPELDFEVRDAVGRLLGRSEIAYPEQKVAVEYESDHHRVDRRQWDRDIEKYQSYEEAGWTVIRVTSRMLVSRRHELIRQVTRALG